MVAQLKVEEITKKKRRNSVKRGLKIREKDEQQLNDDRMNSLKLHNYGYMKNLLNINIKLQNCTKTM